MSYHYIDSEVMRSHKKLTKTKDVPVPNKYIVALTEELKDYAFDEDRVLDFKGNWRDKGFSKPECEFLDLEIGTGNGYHFAHRAKIHPERLLLGFEIKFKPLIQSIKRALRNGSNNARMARYHANEISQVFAPSELDNVFVHFPDPWPKKRHFKNRLIQDQFLKDLFNLQKPGSLLEFKTDSLSYFDWALEKFEDSDYEIIFKTNDLHSCDEVDHSFMTHFEKIFVSKGIPINYILLKRN